MVNKDNHKIVKTKIGEQHFSVGAIIQKDNKILIIERKLPPSGFAGIAGHVDEKETPEQALAREIKEETNLNLLANKLLFKKRIIQKEDCVYKSKIHKWYLYRCSVSGEIKPAKKEVKTIRYMTKKQIKRLYKEKKLEYTWVILFKKLKVI